MGFAFGAQEMEEGPINATDQALDAIGTPDEVIFGLGWHGGISVRRRRVLQSRR